MKKIFIALSVFLTIVLAIAYYFNVFNWEICPNQYHHYKAWFPYHINDTIVLKSGNKFKTLIVKNIHFRYNKIYDSNKKCGCCENNYTLELADNKKVISIYLENLENKRSCLYTNYRTSFSQDSTEKEIQIVDNYFLLDNITVLKNTGIYKIQLDSNNWEFVHLKKGNKEEYNLSYANCN